MENTKALSPEIIGLFERVQNQSQQYADAFDMLEKSRKEFDAAQNRLNELEDNVRKDSELAISKINTSILESLILLKKKAEETATLNLELSSIKEFKQSLIILQDDLSLLHAKMKVQTDEVDSTLRYFKKKSEMELESTLNGLRAKLDKEIAGEGQKIEFRINLKLRQIENILISLEDKNRIFEDNLSNIFKKLSLEIDLLKNGFSLDSGEITHYSDSHEFQSLSNRLGIIEMMFNTIKDQIDRLDTKAPLEVKHLTDKHLEEIDSKISNLKSSINDLSNRMNDQKNSATTVLAIVAIVMSLIAIAVSFI